MNYEVSEIKKSTIFIETSRPIIFVSSNKTSGNNSEEDESEEDESEDDSLTLGNKR